MWRVIKVKWAKILLFFNVYMFRVVEIWADMDVL